MKSVYNCFLVAIFVLGIVFSSTVTAQSPGKYQLVAKSEYLNYFYMSPARPEESLQTSGFLPACSEGICTSHLQVLTATSTQRKFIVGHPFWKKLQSTLKLKVVNHSQYAKQHGLTAKQDYVRVGNGQCVDLVKRFSKWVSAGNWIRGDKVADYWDPSKLRGKVIATFSCGPNKTKYCANGVLTFDHTAIILAAEGTGNGPITAVWVLEQNVSPIANGNIHQDGSFNGGGGSISKRRIVVNSSASKSFNLNNYYIVTYNASHEKFYSIIVLLLYFCMFCSGCFCDDIYAVFYGYRT